jgi:hypothetical protein
MRVRLHLHLYTGPRYLQVKIGFPQCYVWFMRTTGECRNIRDVHVFIEVCASVQVLRVVRSTSSCNQRR